MTRPAFRPAFYPAFRPAFNKLKSIAAAVRSVYNLDGVDDRGQLAFRAINTDGDIDIEWHLTETVPLRAYSMAIVCQNISTSVSSREFILAVGTSGQLVLQVGGSAYSGGNGLNTAGTHRFLLVGNSLRLFKNGSETLSASFTRGAAREPSAFTTIGVLTAGVGVFGNWFGGPLSNLRINGVFWPVSERDQSIQLPFPTGLGAELITQNVLENPANKASQWTYLGEGRWQLQGTGGYESLRFIDGLGSVVGLLIEFEVESITGTLRLNPITAGYWIGNNLASQPGKYRVYSNSSVANNVEFVRHTTGQVANCIIKNISFKPLGTCNPLTLVNTTPDRWQEVQV